MNNFFENHVEEINLISSRSKKESKSTISRLQKATILNLVLFNDIVTLNNIQATEGINLHQHSEDGHALVASSDRMYLPDVATRLYQNIDNVLKSYKNHKVHKSIPKPKYFSENVTYVENLDVSDWDTQYFIELLRNLYSSFDEIVKTNFDIRFELDGQYSFWTLFSSEGKNIEFDEFSLVLNYSISFKSELRDLVSSSLTISPGDIRNRRIDFSEIKTLVDFYATIFLKDIKSVDTNEISPEMVYLDATTASEMMVNLLQSNSNLVSKYQKNCAGCAFQETFDKYGNKIEESDVMPLRQSLFHIKPLSEDRNFEFELADKSDTDNVYNLENLVQILRTKTKKQKFLLLLGSQHSTFENSTESRKILSPALKIYFDGNNFSFVNFDFMDYTDIDEFQAEGSEKTKVLKNQKTQSKLFVSGIANALFALSEKIKLL